MNIAKYLLPLLALPLLAACAPAPDCASGEVFCAGLVADTLGIEDNGVNQDAWTGIQNIRNHGIIDQAGYIESVDTRDYGKNIAYFAERGYDVIFTSGIGLRDETFRAADQYPDIVFVGINQPAEREKKRANFIPVTFQEDQLGFFAGVLAANLTKTKVIGAACEKSDLDSMWRYCEGFRAGIKSTDQKITLLIAYNDDVDDEKLFVDEEWGRKTAKGMIWRGADVIFAAGGITAQGALREALESDVRVIGAERNQAAELDQSDFWVVTSVYGDAQFEAEKILRELRGEDLGKQTRSPLKFIPLGPKIPETLTSELTTLLTDLWSMKVRTNVTARKP